jgi:hypothetical protein
VKTTTTTTTKMVKKRMMMVKKKTRRRKRRRLKGLGESRVTRKQPLQLWSGWSPAP